MKFYDDGLKFECQKCSFCCGHSPGFVYLSKQDLQSLCKFFGMSIKNFIEKYCRWVNYYYGAQVLALLEKKNYDCILWENGCSAYQARPLQCSAYPFWSWMVKDKETWDDCSRDCPGMNKGRLWTADEIEKIKTSHEENAPLHKDDVAKLIAEES